MEFALLPTDSLVISSTQFTSARLTVRLVTETVGREDGHAYVISASEPRDIATVFPVLESLQAAGEYVYLFWRENKLVVDGEAGQIEIEAKEFSSETAELSTAELRQALAFWRKLYENANEFGTKVQARLRRMQELAIEQERRTSIKAAGHSAEAVAGVLYSQQIEFLKKLLRASEGHDA